MISADLQVMLPEILLALWAMLALLVGAFFGKDRIATPLSWATVVVMVALALWIGMTRSGDNAAFGGQLLDDAFSRFGQGAVLLAGAAVLAISEEYFTRRRQMKFEFPVLMALATTGMMVMVSAGDLITLYMGLETMSLTLYIVASFNRASPRSSEAGLKYFILGSLASGTMLYGASLVYGYAGTTLFSGIYASASGHAPVGLLIGIVLVIVALAFKVSAVPFHMWTPDVYEGAPTPVTTFFATAPKLAAMGLFLRVMNDAFGSVSADWTQVVAVISLFTMFVGAIGGIGQFDFKRMMAYSSISHMGFALMGVAAGTELGVQAALVYLAIYVVMTMGTFAFIHAMARDGVPVGDIRDLKGYSKQQPLKALALLVLMFSLGGVPPTLGFFAKFWALRAALDGDMAWLAVSGVIASVIALFFYLRVVYYMYFGDGAEPLDHEMGPATWAVLVGTALIMVVGLANMFGVEGMAHAAAAALMK